MNLDLPANRPRLTCISVLSNFRFAFPATVPTMAEGKVIPVKVAVRIRPISRKEANEGCQATLDKVDNEPQV